MKRKRFTEKQIISILREREAGMAVADLGRKHGVSEQLNRSGFTGGSGKPGSIQGQVLAFIRATGTASNPRRPVAGRSRPNAPEGKRLLCCAGGIKSGASVAQRPAPYDQDHKGNIYAIRYLRSIRDSNAEGGIQEEDRQGGHWRVLA